MTIAHHQHESTRTYGHSMSLIADAASMSPVGQHARNASSAPKIDQRFVADTPGSCRFLVFGGVRYGGYHGASGELRMVEMKYCAEAQRFEARWTEQMLRRGTPHSPPALPTAKLRPASVSMAFSISAS